jgi:hypothetical protein
MRNITIESLIFHVFTNIISKQPYGNSFGEFIGINWPYDWDEIQWRALGANLNLDVHNKKMC